MSVARRDNPASRVHTRSSHLPNFSIVLHIAAADYLHSFHYIFATGSADIRVLGPAKEVMDGFFGILQVGIRLHCLLIGASLAVVDELQFRTFLPLVFVWMLLREAAMCL